MNIIGIYKCGDCQRQLHPGDFMAVIGHTPKDKLSMPTGRADAIMKTIGDIYCEDCFRKSWQAK